MPNKPPRITIKLDLLRPQGAAQNLYFKIVKWLLSTGRYIIVFVELLVLIAFLSRFKFDADLAETNEAIDQQIPFIESQRADENLIRGTQAKLATIKDFRLNSPRFPLILKSIADQTPQGVILTNLNLSTEAGVVSIRIIGSARSNSDISAFVTSLKEDGRFESVNLDNVSLDQGIINFTITGSAPVIASGEQRS